jgi:hypothetical protein
LRLRLQRGDQVIADEKVNEVFTSILLYDLLNELFRFLDLELAKHIVFYVLILREEGLSSRLLHLSEARRHVNTALLYLSFH